MSDTTAAVPAAAQPTPNSKPANDVNATVLTLIDEGIAAHQSGDLSLAETKYRDALKLAPEHPEGLHLLGIIACQSASYDPAITLIGHAIANHPDTPNVPPRYNVNLANALHGAGRLNDAVVALHRALSADPSSVEGHYNLGNVLSDLERFEEAEGEYRFAIQLQPNYGKAHARLSWVLQQQGRLQEAIEEMQIAANINPEDETLRVGLGRALAEDGRFEQALPYLEGIRENDDAYAWVALGDCFAAQQKWHDAKEAFSHGMKLAPREARAHAGLGEALYHVDQSEQALSHLIRAGELDPVDKRAMARAGMISLDQGDFHMAIDRLEEAMGHSPRDHHAHTAFIHSKSLTLTDKDDRLKAEFDRWMTTHAGGRTMPMGRTDRLDPHRTLCIGFVTGRNPGETGLQALLALLGYRRREAIETRCYVDLDESEPLYTPLKQLADGWVDARGMTDGELSSAIHADRVDILIDLAGYRPCNRLKALARRPAPIQIAWLGHLVPGGFPFFDYDIVDGRYAETVGEANSAIVTLQGDQSTPALALENGPVGFIAPDEVPDPGPLPCADGKAPVFACLGDLAQLTEETIALFSRVLTADDESKLRIIVRQPIHRETDRRLRRRFVDYGVSDTRVSLVSVRDGDATIADLLAEADLALDPFPTSNGYESFAAMLHGLPVVTLKGTTAPSQLAAGILDAAGMAMLTATSIEEFTTIATALVQNPQKLADLRSTLPERVINSSLTDGTATAAIFESAMRQTWTVFCAERQTEASVR